MISDVVLELSLFGHPVSINSAYYNKANGKIRTKEYREWGDELLVQMRDYKSKFDEFLAAYDETKHGIAVDIVHTIPKRYYYTVEGLMSSRTPDITNIEKPLIDMIFDAKYNGRIVKGKKVYNLAINDKNIVKMKSAKYPSNLYTITVKIQLLDLPIYSDPEDETNQ